jgi:hypothetical protein
MPTDHRAKLATIKRFDQLIAYLRDEMDWPIEDGRAFEDLTFEYLPEEIGIDVGKLIGAFRVLIERNQTKKHIQEK